MTLMSLVPFGNKVDTWGAHVRFSRERSGSVSSVDSGPLRARAFSPQKWNCRGTTLFTCFYLRWKITSALKMTVFGRGKGYVKTIQCSIF